MADIVTLTKAAAQAILNQTVVGGSINGAGHLILTKKDGSTIDAGDFTGIVTGILNTSVNTAVNTAVPNAVAGKFVDRGNIAGTLTFTDAAGGSFTKDNLPNALIDIVLGGNLTINASDLPANPRPNTQFVIRFTQDGTGSRILTLNGFKKSQGSLVLTTAANAIDMVVFFFDGTSWFAGFMGVDFK